MSKYKRNKAPIREEKDGNLRKLKQRIMRLEKENDSLRKQVNTLEAYRALTNKYIDNHLNGVSVEKVITGIQNKENLKQIKEKADMKANDKRTFKEKIDDICSECGGKSVYSVMRFDGSRQFICKECDHREVRKAEKVFTPSKEVHGKGTKSEDSEDHS